MTSSTESASLPNAKISVAAEGGGSPMRGLAAPRLQALEPPREWMQFCSVCDFEERFVAVIELANGLWGFCSGCGVESVVAYTRTVA
jgi:hypothetical protein